MASGDWVFRIILIVPVGAKLTNIVAFLVNQNIDPTTTAAKWPGLSASGNTPVTHRWWNGAVTKAEAKLIIDELIDRVNAQQPGTLTKKTAAEWAAMTHAEARAWLNSIRNAVWSVFAVVVLLAVQIDVWDDPDVVLAAVPSGALKRIGNAAVA